MKGSVTKYAIAGSSRPRWRYRIEAGTDGNGKRIQEGRGGFTKQALAEDAMEVHIRKIGARTDATRDAARIASLPRVKTLGEWLTEWLDLYAPDKCQPKTLERYRGLVAYITASAEGDPCLEISQTPINGLKHAPIEAALFALLRARGKRRAHISARTVRHVAGVLSVALNKALRLDLIDVNPMPRVELPTPEKKDAFSLTPEQILALRTECRGDWTFALVELALATGARRGELLSLTWPDVDWVSSTLTISKSLEQTRDGLRVKRPKNEKQRRGRLPQSGIVALQFLRDEQKQHRRMFGAAYKDNNLVFCQAGGEFHAPDLVSQVIIRRMRKAGIKSGSFHTLRHTHASILLSRGVALPAVSARLGHSDASITSRVYSHAIPADDQRAADEWDGLIGAKIQ